MLVRALRAGLIRSLEQLLLALSDRLNSPGLNPGRYGERINHYTVLGTIQAMYGLAPLAHSADQQPINDIWHYETVPPTADRLPLPGGLLIK